MAETIHFDRASYLGGHRSLAVSSPLGCRITVDEQAISAVDLVTLSSVTIAWDEVERLEVVGANTGELRTSPSATLFLGLVGLAMQERKWTTCIAITLTSGAPVGFLVADYTSQSLRAQLARVKPAAQLLDQPPTTAGPRWQYHTASLDELDELGALGWEAVGVFVVGEAPHALMKRIAG